MYACMHGQTDGWTFGWIDEGRMGAMMDEGMDGCNDGLRDGWVQ